MKPSENVSEISKEIQSIPYFLSEKEVVFFEAMAWFKVLSPYHIKDSIEKLYYPEAMEALNKSF